MVSYLSEIINRNLFVLLGTRYTRYKFNLMMTWDIGAYDMTLMTYNQAVNMTLLSYNRMCRLYNSLFAVDSLDLMCIVCLFHIYRSKTYD